LCHLENNHLEDDWEDGQMVNLATWLYLTLCTVAVYGH
jgi:hypothetical protein